MIFDKNLSEPYPNMDYSTFIVDEKYFNLPFDSSNADSANTPIEHRDFAFINYSKIDNGLSDRDDRHLAVGAVYSYYEEWENLDKDAYSAKKQKLQDELVKRLESVYPDIMQHCIHIELATPKTIER